MTNPTRLIADNLFDLIVEALDKCSEHQSKLFRLVYGLHKDGIGDPCEVSEAARLLGLNRYTAHITLARARAAVFEHVAARQVDQMTARLEVWFGEDVEELAFHAEEGMRVKRHGRTSSMPGSVTLGEGSEEHSRIERNVDSGAARRQARIDAHQRYAKGGDS